MKKYLLITFCSFLFAFTSSAQTNLGFENWTNMGTYEDPTDWQTLNLFTAFGGNVSAFKMAPHWGKYSLGLAPTSVFGSAIPGIAVQQVYYTKRPKSVSLYYRYNSTAGDSANFGLELSNGPTSNPSNPIGSANIMLPAAKNWTKVQADIIWTSAMAPDSLTIVISGNFDNTTDTLQIDDIGISMFGLAVDQPQKPVYNIFLNANNYLIIDPELMIANSRIIIRNMLGQVVLDQTTSSNAIDLNNMQNGMYAYEIFTDNNTPVAGKFIR